MSLSFQIQQLFRSLPDLTLGQTQSIDIGLATLNGLKGKGNLGILNRSVKRPEPILFHQGFKTLAFLIDAVPVIDQQFFDFPELGL